jgi:hypothetical protein
MKTSLKMGKFPGLIDLKIAEKDFISAKLLNETNLNDFFEE